ncbi:hypothetical protein BJ875DRAFT_493517 [Amylocarpus encephaloides]|uniref:Azaphilone pigments biosynthesis cluster protein L N-terminal domain-containing protein n=1 Tax=Amylocarpus encephaloides TaxID=45428 RepID=A0A9P8C8C6_9HELO|nr:hypothetical protein BJ875DRAFT_493517 [Amylocarpus encephaloides]
MAEPLSIIAAATAIVKEVSHLTKDLHNFIEGISQAPKHINALNQDVQSMYLVLGSLEGMLENLNQGSFPMTLCQALDSVRGPLQNCFETLKQLQRKLVKFTRPSGVVYRSKWAAFRWQFTQKDANAWREHLSSYKLTVNMALSAANIANTSNTITTSRALKTQVAAIGVKIDAQEPTDPNAACSNISEDGSKGTDRYFALGRFLDATETSFADSPPDSPIAFTEISDAWPQLEELDDKSEDFALATEVHDATDFDYANVEGGVWSLMLEEAMYPEWPLAREVVKESHLAKY